MYSMHFHLSTNSISSGFKALKLRPGCKKNCTICTITYSPCALVQCTITITYSPTPLSSLPSREHLHISVSPTTNVQDIAQQLPMWKKACCLSYVLPCSPFVYSQDHISEVYAHQSWLVNKETIRQIMHIYSKATWWAGALAWSNVWSLFLKLQNQRQVRLYILFFPAWEH